MAGKLDPKQYVRVLRVRKAWRFDLGGLLMRIFAYMSSLGLIAMLTLSGWSYFRAGTVVSVMAVAVFLISPRICKLIDEHGQSKIVPVAVGIQMCGLALMIAIVQLGGPWQLCYLGALLVGFTPNPMALVRARWSYLVETGLLGSEAPDIRTVFTYEGVLDDTGYMIGPAVSLALASLVAPCAGMIFGGVCFITGCALLLSSRDTEPTVGWQAVGSTANDAEKNIESGRKQRSMFVVSSMVRILFAMMLLQGLIYGVYNTSLVAFGQERDASGIISLILASTSVGSIAAGLVFGMARFKCSLARQLAGCAVAFGAFYMLLFFASDMASLAVICFAASFSYAPLLICMNTSCEQSVPGSRLTESLAWMNAGATLGTTVAPSLGGVFVDNYGALAGLNFSAAVAACMIIFTVLFWRVIKREIG